MIFSSDDTATTAFPETPLMPTYLVAFVISDLHNLSNHNEMYASFPQRVFARPAAIQSAQLALSFGAQAVSTLEEYLRINFTIPKMDQVAIPDFEHEGFCEYSYFCSFTFI